MVLIQIQSMSIQMTKFYPQNGQYCPLPLLLPINTKPIINVSCNVVSVKLRLANVDITLCVYRALVKF